MPIANCQCIVIMIVDERLEEIMMKVKCINTENGSVDITVGKFYTLLTDDGTDVYPLHIIDDVNQMQWVARKDFELLPDEPAAPKSDWMRMNDSEYVNIVTGMVFRFTESHTLNIFVAGGHESFYVAPQCSDAFASLVGYKWSDK